jgi:hypothetical protein
MDVMKQGMTQATSSSKQEMQSPLREKVPMMQTFSNVEIGAVGSGVVLTSPQLLFCIHLGTIGCF